MPGQQIFLTPDLAHRLAAIDIGTNSVRLIVADALREGNYRILDEEKETTRLGRQLHSTGKLDPDAAQQTLEALKRMKQIAEGFQARELRVIATCAVREASDGAEFVNRAREELGLEIEVISAEVEARLAFYSVARSFSLEGKNVAVADIGGGSTEIVLASGKMIESIRGTPLGAVRLTEMFGGAACGDEPNFSRMVERIDATLKRRAKGKTLTPHLLIGSGGTFTTLAEIVMADKRQSGLPLRGYEITHADVHHVLDRLRKMSAKARRSVPGLSADRADIIVAGVTIVDRLLQSFKLNRVQIHDRGVRDGLLLTMIDHTLGQTSFDPHDQEAAVERFAQMCGVELEHARQVARLAGQIHSQLVGDHGLEASDRPLLETAARLQDVGYLIDYEKHHKHSYHLILNSRLAGFQPRELELIANVARYHRGGGPKKRHENFQRLSPRDQGRVRKLAAILRLAGGLDRSNSRQVQGVALAVEKDTIRMQVLASECPEVDLWAAERRAEPFEKAFGRKLSITWRDSRPAKSRAREPAK